MQLYWAHVIAFIILLYDMNQSMATTAYITLLLLFTYHKLKHVSYIKHDIKHLLQMQTEQYKIIHIAHASTLKAYGTVTIFIKTSIDTFVIWLKLSF
jgi:hypothetical protein